MGAFGDRIAPPPDAGPASWIAPRLGPFGTVGGLVPAGFDRYLAVQHDPEGDAGDVALHATLLTLAAAHTATPGTVWYAVWEGHGWVGSTLYVVPARGPIARLRRRIHRRRLRRADQRRREEVERGLTAFPRLSLPHRTYFLMVGSLGSATRIAHPGGHGRQPPDLWWPDDRAWFIGSDTDLDRTYVGGSERLAVAIEDGLAGRVGPASRRGSLSDPGAVGGPGVARA